MTDRHETCVFCGANEHDKPMVKTAFRGDTVFFCVACMPKVCQGLDCEKLAEKIRESRSRELDERPLAKPGLRY